jgi:hypothetical protein
MSIRLVDRPEMPDGHVVKPDGAFLSWTTVERRLIESLHYWLRRQGPTAHLTSLLVGEPGSTEPSGTTDHPKPVTLAISRPTPRAPFISKVAPRPPSSRADANTLTTETTPRPLRIG